jgi:hypothetical protein
MVQAYRSDHPVDMRHMVIDDGKWVITEDAEDLCVEDVQRLKLLCGEYGWN